MKTHQQLVDMEVELDACRDRRKEIAEQVRSLQKLLAQVEDRIDDLKTALDEADEEAEKARLAEVRS